MNPMASAGPSHHPTDGTAHISQSMDEDALVDSPSVSTDALHSVIRKDFQSIPTYYFGLLLFLLHVVFVGSSVSVAIWCRADGDEAVCSILFGVIKGESVILFGKVGLWLLVLCFTGCMQHHHGRARSRGYLQFHREMQLMVHVPIIIHSTGNALLLVLLGVGLSPTLRTYVLLGILGMEFVVVLPCLIYYIVKVMKFNRACAAPDVSQEEYSHTYSVTSLPTEMGFRSDSALEEVVEKQADLIEYLKQRNMALSKRLLTLTAQQSQA